MKLAKNYRGDVKRSLERKYKTYITAYLMSFDIQYYSYRLKKQNSGEKELPMVFWALRELCLVFRSTREDEKIEDFRRHQRKKPFSSLLNRVIRTVIRGSNDENGFIIMRAVLDCCETLSHNNETEQKMVDEDTVEQVIKEEELKIEEDIGVGKPKHGWCTNVLETLKKGTFPYMMLLECMEWSIDAVVDFLLEDYSFLELVCKVLKRVAGIGKDEMKKCLDEKERNRIDFFTDELMRRLTEYTGQFSFNILPLVNLLKKVKSITSDEA